MHTFNTQFYPKLSKNGYDGVRKWTKHVCSYPDTFPMSCLSIHLHVLQVVIFACRLLLIPIHTGCHWSLVVIDCTKENIEHYDSLGGTGSTCITRIWYAEARLIHRYKGLFHCIQTLVNICFVNTKQEK